VQIIFATTNASKISEAKEILNVDILPTSLEIPEIQSLDPLLVATHKAQSYFEQINKPLLVEDVSLTFTSLKGLPGPYISDFSKALGNEGLISLLTNSSDRSAIAQTTLVYCDHSGKTHPFIGVLQGTISTSPLGSNGFGWDPIFIPQGHNLTLAQMDANQKNALSMRSLALRLFKSWLDTTQAK
jgi:non-canonical purine NTP pyrophosphatase (RdgB/HAM1 family)